MQSWREDVFCTVNYKLQIFKQGTMASSSKKGATQNGNNFTEEDREQLKEINSTMKTLLDKIKEMKYELDYAKEELKEVKIENARLKQALNINIFKTNALDQYERRTNIRIHGIPEANSGKDDGEEKVKAIAKELRIELQDWDIQRAHRLGKKRPSAKPRPIIARFLNYKTRSQLLSAKSNFKNNAKFPGVFITEDLTALRSKLLHYVKEECENNFVMCHTLNGNIRMKKSARKAGRRIKDGQKDESIGNWL